jgi:hypothetical protein
MIGTGWLPCNSILPRGLTSSICDCIVSCRPSRLPEAPFLSRSVICRFLLHPGHCRESDKWSSFLNRQLPATARVSTRAWFPGWPSIITSFSGCSGILSCSLRLCIPGIVLRHGCSRNGNARFPALLPVIYSWLKPSLRSLRAGRRGESGLDCRIEKH